MSRVKVVEVGPRDGLQNEVKNLTIVQKYKLIKKLEKANVKHIEVGAFVSPKWVPQMKGSRELINKLFLAKKSGAAYSALVPNQVGFDHASQTKIKNIAIFAASSEKFSKKNINCSIADSFKRFNKVCILAKKDKIKVRAYLSTAFGCPYEGKVSVTKVVSLTKRLLKLGVYEVAISDTIGVATPADIFKVVSKLLSSEVDIKKIALHLHNTRGMALANILEAYKLGVRTFDSSIGGLGGCPYAKGASGNLATEDLVYMLNGMKVKTGISLNELIKIKKWIESDCKIMTKSYQ